VNIAVVAVGLVVNLLGVNSGANLLSLCTVVVLCVYGALVVLSFPHLEVSRLHSPFAGWADVQWSTLLNLLTLVFSGFASTASLVEHVADAKKNLPTATAAVGVCTTVVYMLSLTFPYLAVRDADAAWSVGHFADVAGVLGGRRFKVLFVAATAFANMQSFVCSLQTATYTVESMAKHGVLPATIFNRSLLKLDARKVPRNALAACGALSAAFAFVPFSYNLSLSGVLIAIILAGEVSCFLRLRAAQYSLAKTLARRRALVLPAVLLAVWLVVTQAQTPLFVCLAGLAVVVVFCAQEERELPPVTVPPLRQKLVL
jgi:amino acid transporter